MLTHRIRLQSLPAVDAATCAAMGTLLLAASGPVAALTELPASLLLGAGLVLLPIALFMAIASRAALVPRWAAKTVVLGNWAWVLASIALPLSGLVRPNAIGWVFLIGQAAVVAVLAKLEHDASNTQIHAG